jgi:hypothetical protein
MNIHKLRRVLEHIKSQGKLPTDTFGEILSVDELILWFGLNQCLSVEEQRVMKQELAQLVEVETCIDMLRMQQ